MVHEALIGAWDRLRAGLRGSAFGLWRQRLKGDLEQWTGKPEEAFLRGGLLAEASAGSLATASSSTTDEMAFIEASDVQRQGGGGRRGSGRRGTRELAARASVALKRDSGSRANSPEAAQTARLMQAKRARRGG